MAPTPGMELSEQQLDSQIRQLQDELQKLQKQRKLVELRSAVLREQRLLEEAQRQLETAQPPPIADTPSSHPSQGGSAVPAPPPEVIPSPSYTPPKGIKRSSSSLERSSYLSEESPNSVSFNTSANTGLPTTLHSATPLNGGDQKTPEPPGLPGVEPYGAANWLEYAIWMQRLQNYFARHQQYFRTDERKIAGGLRQCFPSCERDWHASVQAGIFQPTWLDFQKFLRRPLTPANLSPQAAMNRLRKATQRDSQTVRDFAIYLSSLEASLDKLPSDEERIETLRNGLLPEIREECQAFYDEGNRIYTDHIRYLISYEGNLASRHEVVRKRAAAAASQRPKKRPRYQ
ncbi:hypothetical protein ASPZODRAFT_129371 [Penicilliopsis zonata CBS 506.65]|uniref:Retrotransposon gag domain-containing protein n=1 Tax=Penicilliopsis zonata CBS 506.65 TaxID=1073090 RepID=A0A1L9SPH5_9EURO|nr:hypothetical protein ASPZODRAFT_129371 [Penicilliopsis zonata CBS 506.65]OJJ49003.1 hypothetical protein ASPZODRAFT_129371 [Penicilliopsis zonata CBS 506.65]